MTETDRTAYAAAQTFGLALITGAFATVVALTVALLGGEDIGLLVVLLGVTAAATFVTWRFDRQVVRGLGLLGTVLSLGGFFLAFGVFQVFSPLEFIVGLTYVVGFAVSLVSGIAAMFASRKERRATERGAARVRVGVLVGLGIAGAISLVGFGLTRTTVAAADAAGAIELDMVDFEFEPHDSVVFAGGRLLIHNSDAFAHDFTLDENDLYTYIGPGGEAIVDLSGLSPGEYEYFCSLHTFVTEDGEKEGMTGFLTIEG